MSGHELVERALSGDRRALSRVISMIEAHEPSTPKWLMDIPEERQPARRVGITGPPGAGKSTLVSAMISELRWRGLSVAVLAVDPTSPVTGGALLGDRIRMQDHADDPGVFVRSMASRGHLGGLSEAAPPVIGLLARSGFDLVLVETVGVGQSEVEVMDLVDQVVLVLSPGWGDQIQADKAGITEVTDIFVINKGDRPGVDSVKRALSETLAGGRAPILVTTAITGEGVAELVDAVV